MRPCSRLFKLSLMALFPLLLAAGCGSQNSSQKNAFTPRPELNFEEEAQPTLVIPPAQNDVEYQPAPEVVLNNGTQIHLNRTQLTNPRIFYTSAERRLVMTANLAILAENRTKLIEKSISLSGTHTDRDSSFTLDDQIAAPAGSDLKVKAIANCLDLDSDNNVSCGHVVVDVVIQHNGKYYSEQVEVNRNRSTPQIQPQAPTPPPTTPPSADNTEEDAEQDQNGLQEEGPDDAIDGRYQGELETIDLTQFFEEPAPAPQETPPPAQPPSADTSTPQSGDQTVAPPPPSAPPPSEELRVPPPPAPPAPRVPPAAPPSADASVRRDRELSPDLTQTRDGEVRPRNQAVGFPDRGRLQNPTSMITRGEALGRRAYFEVASPTLNKHFATYEMAEMIVRTGNFLHQRYGKKTYLSRVSARRGGRLPPSVSHQIGNDVDLGYPNTGTHRFPLVVTRGGSYHPRNYSVEQTYHLFKHLFSQRDIEVERMFIDRRIKAALCEYAKSNNELRGPDRGLVERMFANLQHSPGHGDHFHMRIKCSRFDPGCRGRVYRRIENCR